jgi:hypothetical protein
VPCDKSQLCIDEDKPENVINNYQFTFKIRDLNQARFMFISIVACTRDTETCQWHDLNYNANESDSKVNFDIDYDIWFVNGHPSFKSSNFFEHEFTYELHDIIEIYLISFLVYLIMISIISVRLYRNFHYLYFLLFIYVAIELLSRLLLVIHCIVFCSNGEGLFIFDLFGNLLDGIATSVLFLILICIGKGWCLVRGRRLKLNKNFYFLFSILQSIHLSSHMISLVMIDPIFNTNPYETYSGYVEICIRLVCMIWFIVEVQKTFQSLESIILKSQSQCHQINRNQNEVPTDYVFINDQVYNDDENEDFTSNNENIQSSSDDEENDVKKVNGKVYKSLKQPQTQSQAESKTSTPNEATLNLNRLSVITTNSERLKTNKKFYLHYAACCLVWFIYLPGLIFVTSFLSELYRLRLLLSKFTIELYSFFFCLF